MQQLFWKKVEIENKTHGRPPKLEEGCSISYMGDQNKYVMTGGVKHPFNIKDLHATQGISIPPKSIKNFGFKNTKPKAEGNVNQDYVYIFEPAEFQWKIQSTSGRVPSRRVFHHVWYEAPYLFVFGGATRENKTLNDIHMLNTETYQWKRFFYLEGPPPRLHSGFAGSSSRKFIVGGSSMPENLLLNDIWMFSFENVAWESQSLELPGIIWQRLEPKQGVKLLPPIKGQSLIQISETELFLYGGFNQNKQTQDLSLLINTDQESITPFETKGVSPGARGYHSIMMVKENLLCLFGGITGAEDNVKPQSYLNDLYLLNLNEKYWSVPIVGGYVPTPRYMNSFSGNQNEIYGEVLVLGGRVQDGSYDQCVYILHELDMDAREAWDERNDEEKNQFASYRDALKRDKKQSVPTLNLEFNEAEKIIVDQKRLMGEKEREFKKIQNDQVNHQQQTFQCQERILKTKETLDERLVKVRQDTDQMNAKSNEDQELINKVKLLLAFERKKRKLLQRKASLLEDAFRKAEKFIITLDQFYSKGLKEDAFAGNVNEDYLLRIEKSRTDHRLALVSFRSECDESFKREQQVKSDLKSMKQILKPFEQISQIYHTTLSKDEIDYIAKKK